MCKDVENVLLNNFNLCQMYWTLNHSVYLYLIN